MYHYLSNNEKPWKILHVDESKENSGDSYTEKNIFIKQPKHKTPFLKKKSYSY